MSKNKNYHNYQNYQNRNFQNNTPVAKVEEEPVVEVQQEEVIDVVDVIETPAEPVNEPEVQPEVKTVTGTVNGCEKLNVRVAPNAEATPATVINKGATVVIDEKLSTDEWYRVCTETGVEGYCMKQFIKVNA